MLKIINRQLVTFNIQSKEEDFECTITIYYHYGCFKFKKFQYNLELSNELTMNTAYKVTKELIRELNNVTKLNN